MALRFLAQRQGLGWLLLSLAAVYALWGTPLLFPLKMAVVFFHELSHGIGGVLTGGTILEIYLDPRQGGHCKVLGGNAFVLTSAGYVGSALWGALIMILAGRTRWDRVISVLLGLMMIGVGFFHVRPLLSFGMIFTLITGLAWIAVGWLGRESINGFLLQLAGLVNIIYAPLDIQSDIFARPWLTSDAVLLEGITGISRFVWGGIWMAISLVVAVLALRYSLPRKTTPSTVPKA